MLEVSLRKAGFTVTPAASVQDALDKLELHAPDLIISETTFTDGDGFELRRRVRAIPDWAEIPFIFLTAEAAIENKIKGLELGVDDYLTKPIYIKEIVTRINILLQKRQRARFEERKDGHTRFAGRVADMPVVDVIQTIEISRKSGVIQFVGERGRQAAIYFRDGRVIDAEAGTLTGEDAVYRLLTWSEGEFEVVFRTVRRREVITTSSQGLLMEGMRRLDEWSRLLEQLPPLTHRFEIDAGELAARLGDVPDNNNRILRLFDGKRTLIEVMDASDFGDLECIQAIARLYFESMLLDLDHDAPMKRDTGKPMPLVEVDAPTPLHDAVSGPIPQAPVDTARVSDASIISEEVVAEAQSQEPQALMGAYRPSSLMLIDAAVAAAQAIEPTLVEDEPAAVPEAIEADEHSPLPPPRRTKRVSAPPPPEPPRGREDSGLRMIGSLGRDRAEASGELVPPGSSSITTPISETQRELVTILPRRITREMAAVAPPPEPPPRGAETAKLAAPVEPPVRPRTMTPPRIFGEGSGVVARRSGPGGAAIALIILAALLAGTAVFMLVKKSRQSDVATTRDAGFDTGMLVADVSDGGTAGQDAPFVEDLDAYDPPPAHDAWEPPRADAGVQAARPDAAVAMVVDAAVAVVVDAAIPLRADAGVTPRPDAAVTTPDAGAGPGSADPAVQAKLLMQKAHEANQEGDFAKALALADSSLKLRRTARAHLVRAQALQRLGRLDDALEAVDAAEELAPDFASVFEMRGSILWAAGRRPAARRVYERFLELEPDSARATQVRKRIAEQP
ncbi:MAG: DUF4388 domain-containing protein [Deltaproteobacteria bacterium]|nr:DUF4388 domain-containing protein [Deltaproteobacteria bacterium]